MHNKPHTIKEHLLHVEAITNPLEIDKILSNDLVYQLAHGTGDSKPKKGTYREVLQKQGFWFVGIYHKKKIIGVFSFRQINGMTVEGHINVLVQAHHKGFGKEAMKEGFRYLKENTKYQNVLTYVPANCHHILNFMKRNELECTGQIKNGCKYANEVVNLLIFQRIL